MLKLVLQILTMVMMLASLVLMGSGYGLHLSLLGLCVCLLNSSRATAGVFCLIFGTQVLGFIFVSLGYPGVGGEIAVLAGLLLLHSRYPLDKAIGQCRDGVIILAWCMLVLLFFYMYGPQNSYAALLMVLFVKNGFISLVAFFYCFRDKSIDWKQLGLAGIFSGLIYLAAGGRIAPIILPLSVLDVGHLRIMNQFTEPIISTHKVSFLPVLGFMFVYSNYIFKQKPKTNLLIVLIPLVATVVMIGWSGARQGIFFLVIGALSIFAYRIQKNFRRYIAPVTAIALLLYIMINISFSQKFIFFTGMFDNTQTLYTRLNRDQNFDAAIWLFEQRPLLGHGLGGYYIPGYTRAGAGEGYAHNFLLDMLSQLGLLGTISFFSPLFLSHRFRKRIHRLRKLQNGNTVLPILLVFFLHSMVSGAFFSIAQSIALVAVIPLRDQKRTKIANSINKIPSKAKELIERQPNSPVIRQKKIC
jgi:O-antigen ligase